MVQGDRESLSTPVADEQPPTTPTRHRSPTIVLDDSSAPPSPQVHEHTSASSAAPSSSGVDENTSAVTDEKKKNKSSASRPPSTTGAKPKSSKSAGPPRSPSPTPPPPPVRAPLQTVRLEITLGGPENYEVNIAALAKETGQRPQTPTPTAKRHDTSDDSQSEGDDEGEGKKLVKKRRKKKSAAQEYYDVADPFIDDSELAVDERTFFAQTKQQGFYVSSGQVALLTDNISNSNGTKQAKPESGTESPSALYTENDDHRHGDSASALKRKSSEGGDFVLNSGSSASGSKKKRKVEIVRIARCLPPVAWNHDTERNTLQQPFHPELEAAIQELRDAITKEPWDVKGKFPPSLKPILAQVALKAIILGEYDDNFFNLMPRIFPYNRFTMFKLIKRTIWRQHTDLLLERQNALVEELRKLAEEGFSRAQEEWKRSVSLWEKRHERAKVDTEGGEAGPGAQSQEGTPVPSDNQITPNPQNAPLPARPAGDDGDNDTSMDLDEAGGVSITTTGSKGRDAFAARDANPPQKKYRLTDKMKEIIWQLVCMSNECCRLENEKNQLENNNQVVSDQGVRKTLYQKIVAAFPDGWLTSGQISREVSVMKKKYEKESAEIE
ncbi:hypothetical protein BDW22DRAFT_1332926 [Trametopsis cervina]|nr:hypothetical protein BDW22DRAFT_1332926 [Trametopsis cervina]